MDFEFRPRVIPSVIALGMITCFATLGLWQLTRFIEKSALEDEWNSRRSQPPIVLTTTAGFDVAVNDYRQVTALGALDTSRVAYFDYHRFRGEPGCLVASPMTLRDGGSFLVLRGFVPHTREKRCTEHELSAPAAPDGFTALVHEVKPNLADVANRAQTGDTLNWHTFDVDGTYAAWDIEDGPDAPTVLILDQIHRGDPFPYATFEHLSEPYLTAMRHLNYAGTWLLLVLFAVAGWGAASMRRVPTAS